MKPYSIPLKIQINQTALRTQSGRMDVFVNYNPLTAHLNLPEKILTGNKQPDSYHRHYYCHALTGLKATDDFTYMRQFSPLDIHCLKQQ